MHRGWLRQVLFPILAAMIWGTAFVFQRVASAQVAPFTYNAARSVVAAVFLFTLLLLKNRRSHLKKPEPANRRKLITGGILCGIALFAASNLQQFGLTEVGAGKAGFITALYIVIVPILGLFLRRRTSVLMWLAVMLAAVGLYLLCVTDGFSLAPGDLYLLLCALAFSVHIMLIDRFGTGVDGIALSGIMFAVAGVLSGIVAVFLETPNLGGLRQAMWGILYVGIFSSGVAYTLQILAQQGSNPVVVSLLLSLESVFATISGAIVLHERLSLRGYIGCTVMLAAVVLAQVPQPKRLSKRAPKPQ